IAEATNLYAEDYGFDVDVKGFDWSKLVESRQAYIGRIHQSYDRVLGNNKVNVIKGFARFVSGEGVDEKTIEVNGEHYTADHIL
ncbi:glutathione-disulfide reductase, partial [Escherichia coli]|nr:glutathione-disulfide reductase [Escherichia coli]